MSTRCADGHDSDEPDYCSVCGAPMPTGSAGVAAGAPGAASGAACPACGEPRADLAARFCEVCRYDFVARKPGPPPAAPAPASRAPATAPVPAMPAAPREQRAPSGPAAAGASRRKWEVVLVVDPTLDTEPDPAVPCPQGAPELVFPVDTAEMLVGRRDDQRDIRPEIPLNDPGASRRHAKVVVLADGNLALQDLASTNGTRLNGADVAPGSRRPLAAGDDVTLGRWTRLRVRERT